MMAILKQQQQQPTHSQFVISANSQRTMDATRQNTAGLIAATLTTTTTTTPITTTSTTAAATMSSRRATATATTTTTTTNMMLATMTRTTKQWRRRREQRPPAGKLNDAQQQQQQLKQQQQQHQQKLQEHQEHQVENEEHEEHQVEEGDDNEKQQQCYKLPLSPQSPSPSPSPSSPLPWLSSLSSPFSFASLSPSLLSSLTCTSSSSGSNQRWAFWLLSTSQQRRWLKLHFVLRLKWNSMLTSLFMLVALLLMTLMPTNVLAAQRMKETKTNSLSSKMNAIGNVLNADVQTAAAAAAAAPAEHRNFSILTVNSTAAAAAGSTSTQTAAANANNGNNNNAGGHIDSTTTAIARATTTITSAISAAMHSNNNNNNMMKSGSSGGANRNAIEPEETPSHIGDGPYFDKAASKNVTALLGKTAYLTCRVKNLGNRTMLMQVSWVRHRDIHLLTVGRYTYTSDQRFRAIHQPQTDDWVLQIKYPQHRDSGIYECQVSTTPHLSHYIHLNVVEPATEIIGAPDLYIESGSTINLTCVILNSPEPPAYIFWNHNNEIINYDSPRGGVSVVTNKGDTTTSFLLIKTARPSDSGLYQCNPSNAKARSVTVHVLNGVSHSVSRGIPSSNAARGSATTAHVYHTISYGLPIGLLVHVLVYQATIWLQCTSCTRLRCNNIRRLLCMALHSCCSHTLCRRIFLLFSRNFAMVISIVPPARYYLTEVDVR